MVWFGSSFFHSAQNSTNPSLAIPDLAKQFVVETDASKSGIGAALMQDNHSLAFISRWKKLPVYKKELLAMVFAVQ